MRNTGKLSIIIPFFNEKETVTAVLEEVLAAQPEAEVIAVDDGSSDGTWDKIRALGPRIRAFRLTRNRGQSAALYYGLQQATGEFVAFLDGDGQNDPADIQALANIATQADLVCGYRAKRKDTAWKRFESKVGRFFRGLFFKDGIRDTGCSLKVFRREVGLQVLVLFNGMHRFIPLFFKEAGLAIKEVPVNHRERIAGISKYGNITRGLRGLMDLIGLKWFMKRKINFPEVIKNA